MCPSRVRINDPCPVVLLEILTVARMSQGVDDSGLESVITSSCGNDAILYMAVARNIHHGPYVLRTLAPQTIAG